MVVRLLFVTVCAGLLGLAAEGTARLWYAVREARDSRRAVDARVSPPQTAAQVEAAGRALGLDPYEIADAERPGRWRLRPGYRATVREMLAAKRAAGRILAARYMEEQIPRLGMSPEDISVEIDADGYRGPALDPTHDKPRILALGDSCTFGSPLSQERGYPRVLERELDRLGLPSEVVNGGVEGYRPSDVLARIDEYAALRPEISTVYIGWNALYTERYLDARAGIRRHLHVARFGGDLLEFWRERFGNRQQSALAAFARERRPDRGAPELRVLSDYRPSFMPHVLAIVDRMQAAGSRVVLVTLPGLYRSTRDPSPRALAIGHLPSFTDNPFVLARMADRYNDLLRSLARERGLVVVDLARWAEQELETPEDHFFDSVHFDEPTQGRIGAHMASVLASLVAEASRPDRRPQQR